MPGIGVILNPHSKRYKKYPEELKKMGFIVGDKASCRATDTMEHLEEVVHDFKNRDIDILAISGGDGTLHCTLTSFIRVYGDKPLPKICLLRGGTLNAVATIVGVKGTPETLLSNLMVKYHEDIPFQTTEMMLTKVNDQYGFIFGLGVIYRFMEDYYSNPNVNALIAAKTLCKAIGSAIINGKFARGLFERFDADVIVNGKKWPFANYSAIYSGSMEELGLNFKTFYHVPDFPGQFHAIGFSLPPRNIIPYVPLMYFGKPSGCPNMLEEPATEMIIKLQKPMSYTIDGDMKKPLDYFHVSSGPKITILVK